MEFHDKLLNEVKAIIGNNIFELQAMGYDNDFICRFLGTIETYTHNQWLDFTQARDEEFDHMPQNNPARY